VRRLVVLVTVALFMVAMLVVMAAPAMAAAIRPPIAGIMGGGGTPVPATVCESQAVISPLIGWRNGTCWVFHPSL
jgi:hypothetical protein